MMQFSSPRIRTAGSPDPFFRTRSAAAAASSATAITVAASARPSRSGAPRRSTSGAQPRAADRDLDLALAPRAAPGVGDHDGADAERGAQRAR